MLALLKLRMWGYDSMRDEPPNEMLMDENDTVEFWRLCSVGDLTSAESLPLPLERTRLRSVHKRNLTVRIYQYEQE